MLYMKVTEHTRMTCWHTKAGISLGTREEVLGQVACIRVLGAWYS
jgi:hypothetical protein